MIVSNGIKHTQILTHAHEAVRWKSIQETLSKGGRPEQTLLHVWLVLVSCGLNALLYSLGQLPQLLDLPQVLIRFLALFLILLLGLQQQRSRGHRGNFEDLLTGHWNLMQELVRAAGEDADSVQLRYQVGVLIQHKLDALGCIAHHH